MYLTLKALHIVHYIENQQSDDSAYKQEFGNSGKEKPILTGRNLYKNQTQGRAAGICRHWLGNLNFSIF